MLEINHVTKIFNQEHELERKIALDDVTLSINDGDFVTIIGGNGSGKSTLMNVISGSIKPESGKILIDNLDITSLPEYKRSVYIGRVFQDPLIGSAKSMNLEENLELAFNRGKKRDLSWGFNKKRRENYRALLQDLDLGLENRLESKMGLLSGGQRQAVTLLMATLNTPKILLLDEHTAALDPKTANIVMQFTEKIVKEKHLTTLMITHNMKDAIKYGNRLIMLNNGKIVFDIKGSEKQNLTVNELLNKFENNSDISIDTDLMF